MRLSVIITSYNEGDEVLKTIESVRANTSDCEIILVDDASTDGSCPDSLVVSRILRHDTRQGVVPSRMCGVRAAVGDCYAFLDAHQRVSEGCLNRCAELALESRCITYPDVIGFGHPDRKLHGAVMLQREGGAKDGVFDAKWRRRNPRDPVSRISSMISPGYVIPASCFESVRWSDGMENFGGSEPGVSVKAFFTDTDILHLCGPSAHHLFKGGRGSGFACSWAREACNHAITARVCFTDRTWRNYWVPQVFSKWLSAECLEWFDQEIAVRQHKQFQAIKQRPDSEFWRGVQHKPAPEGVSD